MSRLQVLFPFRAAVWHACVAVMMLSVAAAGGAAEPRSWPQQPIRVVAGQQPGSATDNIARLLAHALSTELGVSVAVDNRPGAGGRIGAEAVARAAPDGHTLLVAGASNLVVAAAMEPDLRYDPVKDFVAIGRLAHVQYGFAVHPAVPARTMGELVELARASPGRLTYVSLGAATTTGYGMATFLREASVDMLAVEYRGISSAIPDVLAGRVDVLFNEIAVLAEQAQAGRLRILAIASPRRAARVPDIPTTAEQGFPKSVVNAWFGLLAPAGTPAHVLKRLEEAYQTIVRSPAMRSRIEALGYVSMADAPGQFAAAIRDEIAVQRATVATGGKASAR